MTPDEWTKSTYSNDSSSCVQWRRVGDMTQIRDGKDPDGPVLTFNDAEWRAFTAGVRAGEFGEG